MAEELNKYLSGRFLVVDDSGTMRRIITNTLVQVGISKENVIEAEDGDKGFSAYKEKGPFVTVLTDWNMPIMNGLELVKKIREKDQDVPIIMVTTEGGKAEVITALKAGVNNYIVKPFTADVLKTKLLAIFGLEDVAPKAQKKW